MRLLVLGLIAVFCLGHAAPGRAAVLFQSTPTLTASASKLGLCSSCSGSKQVYDDFSLSESGTIAEIDFAVSNISFSAQPITVGIYTLVNGLPASQVYSAVFSAYGYAATGHLTNVVTVFPVDWSLAAGAYDITFYNPSLLNMSGYAQSGRALYQAGTGFFTGYSTAFALIGSAAAVPEPLSVALFGLALIVLAAVSRQRPRPSMSPIGVRQTSRSA